jgi:hypothetical protein
MIPLILPRTGQYFLAALNIIYIAKQRYKSSVDNLMEQLLLENVLEAISDSKSLDIFRSIAKGTTASKLLKQGGLSKKQYYRRTSQLLKTGLVKRSKGQFSLTTFGLIVYHAQLVMESGIDNFWKLKAIDSIEQSGQVAEQERIKLIKTILNDNEIENILCKQN